MSYTVFTDGCSNLPGEMLANLDIRVLPCSYTMDGEPGVYLGDIDTFDTHGFYEKLRNGSVMKTSLLNTHLFLTHFRPELEKGLDVIYVGMSSGISGTIQSAGFGTGLLTCRASDLRAEGLSAAEAADILDKEVMQLLQFFTVDDLNFLKRTGRVSGATAMIGTVLNIKPLLWGDPTGHIVACGKYRGRKKAVDAIVEQYRARAVDAGNRRVAISHGDCPEEAQLLAERICQICKPKELIVYPHEPFTGAHVGPGMLALFFFGESR